MCPRNQPIFWELSEKTGRKKKKKDENNKVEMLIPIEDCSYSAAWFLSPPLALAEPTVQQCKHNPDEIPEVSR